MQLPLYPLIRFYFRSTGTRNLKLNYQTRLSFSMKRARGGYRSLVPMSIYIYSYTGLVE